MMAFSKSVVRFLSVQKIITPKICIVGAGTAGFYAAQHLIKHLPLAEIDIYEKLPVPFGLVRYGVAPDHPEVKNVISTFTKTAQHPKIKFVGNIALGKDISLKVLQEAYHIVLLAYGADENRKLNIPGEDLQNSISARDIVGWYNGIPWNSDLQIDLSGPTVTVFGQGNVAIDVARILLSPIKCLQKTDITDHALDTLMTSRVKEVHLVGRRGPLQAAFTIKELREMLKLENCATRWCLNDFDGISEVLPTLARPKKRITELMLKSANENITGEKVFMPKFFRSPVEILGAKSVEGAKVRVNKLVGEDILKQSAVPTDKVELIDCNLVVTSIGYKSIQVDVDIPFNFVTGTVDNKNGKISDGLYATGWLATGPVGVILTTMNNAFITADSIVKDLQNSDILSKSKEGFVIIEDVLRKSNTQIVSWDGWVKIDKYEQTEGESVGKPRKKILNISKMLEIALS